MKLKAEKVHEIKIDAFIDWPELKKIICTAVETELLSQGQIDPGLLDFLLKIEIKQSTEGSPSYPVSKWQARVTGVAPL